MIQERKAHAVVNKADKMDENRMQKKKKLKKNRKLMEKQEIA